MKSAANLGGSSGAGGAVQFELFERTALSPTFPPPSRLAGKALTMLLNAPDGITTPDFQARTRSWRLAAYVHVLIHKHGWPIEALEIPFADDRARFIAKYVMPQWARDEIGTGPSWS
jgi:hypothetical protein